MPSPPSGRRSTTVAETTSEPAAPQEVEPGLLEQQADGRYALMGGRCETCGAHSLRLLAVCPSCWTEGSLRPQALARAGRVASTFTASRSHERTTTSPALLVSTRRVPLVTGTSWLVRGVVSGPPGRA